MIEAKGNEGEVVEIEREDSGEKENRRKEGRNGRKEVRGQNVRERDRGGKGE